MILYAHMDIIVISFGLFALCFGLLRILKRIVDRCWPSDLVGAARQPSAAQNLAVVTSPLPAPALEVPTNGKLHPAPVALEVGAEVTLPAGDIAGSSAN
jgi:hypothetical protein